MTDTLGTVMSNFGETLKYLGWNSPPPWITSWWFAILVTVAGVALIVFSVAFLRKESIADRLAKLKDEGRSLQALAVKGHGYGVSESATIWENKAKNLVRKKLGPSYETRFLDGAGITLYSGNNTDLHHRMERRIRRLLEFIQELHTKR